MVKLIVNRKLLKQQRDALLNGKLDDKNTLALFDFLVEIDMLAEYNAVVNIEGV